MRVKRPTEIAHGELQGAFDALNRALFGGHLPQSLITLQRKNVRTMGYFSSRRFGATKVKDEIDEIAMNPQFFRRSTPIEVLQTMAHEMCHQWQFAAGTPSQRTYHNTEWAAKMESIGLMPSHTGKPGGRKTGQQMMDYPVKGGAFEQVAKGLIKDGFKPSYFDRDEPRPQGGTVAGDGPGESEGSAAAKPKQTRVKFRCGGCGAQAWGKPGLEIGCIPCGEVFVAVA